MNEERTVWPIGIAFVAAGFLFAALAAGVEFSSPVPAIDADRAAIRLKALAEIRAAEARESAPAGWIDQSRGLVRLPIDLAMQITESESRNPAAARADLKARAEKAAAPAPKVPEKPSEFE